MRRSFLSPNGASKSLEIKEKRERVSKTNEGLIFVNKCCLQGNLSPTKVSLMKIIRESFMWKEQT